MKKLFILLTSIFAVSVLAMAQLKLYVHQNDGSYTEFIAATVDSITFSEQTPEKDVANGYEYVDLGLTSGALWATCNLGADKPEEYGDYFAWGELKHKYRYEMNNYVGNASGKYDVYNILELEDDVVNKKMGGAWHIPSPAEINELKDECEWTWTSINNVNGYEVKGPNGNTIFLPAAGVFYETLSSVGESAIYRANAKIGKTTFNLYLDEKYGVRAYYENEAHPGHSIRPVCHKINEKYTLSFSANGGEGEMESMSLQYGERRILPEVSFIRENHAYTTWNTKADGTGTSYNNKSQISITEDIVLYAQWREIKLIDGYEYIDLGLPSGLLWANQNIGASKPEEFGDYFAWGMTEPVKLDNYKWWDDNKYGDECAEVGFELVDDAARQIWGGGWRVPLPEEIEELIAECEWTWTSINNVNGYKVKGPNGNSIFLPAAGSFGIWGPNEELYQSVGEIGFYRGNFKQCQGYATKLTRNQISASVNSESIFGNKTEGYSIRPVRNKTKNIFTLTLDANGGVGEMDSLSFEYGEYKFLLANTYKKELAEFSQWNTKADGSGVSYKDKSQINIKENTTLYAQWNEYMTISFDANSGEGSMENIMLLDPQEIQLPANSFSKYGYVFNGWNTKADGTGVAYQNEELVTLEDNTVLYAQWKDCIVLYLDPNGGEGEIVEVAVDGAQSVVIPTIVLKREGYEFDHWNRKSDGSDRLYMYYAGSSIALNDDMNLYAQWRKYVTITYHANGAEGTYFKAVVLEGVNPAEDNIYSRPGYVFVGWNTEPDGSGRRYTTFVSPNGDMDLYAEWEKLITISYNSNGGSGEVAAQEMQPSKGGKLSENKFNRKGYLFVGWNTKANGSGTTYTEKEQVIFDSNTTLYAQWKEVGEYNGYEYVDLGLSVKWAKCNVGANAPTEAGSYFAWGELYTKSTYASDNYSVATGPTVLPQHLDAANYTMKGNWRMPTKAEFQELIDNCTMTKLSYGVKFTAKNGNYIILPFVGYKDSWSNPGKSYGYYWTSDIYPSTSSKAYAVVVGGNEFYSTIYRYLGLSIRPVLPK